MLQRRACIKAIRFQNVLELSCASGGKLGGMWKHNSAFEPSSTLMEHIAFVIGIGQPIRQDSQKRHHFHKYPPANLITHTGRYYGTPN